jgi:hypothetical protein
MRFSSNALRVRVTGGLPAIPVPLHGLGETIRRVLLAAAIVASFFAAVFVVGVVFVRRRRRPKAAPALAQPIILTRPPAGSATPPADAAERLARATERFRRERSSAALAALRLELFGVAGVGAGATLVDALRALGERDESLRAALMAAEAALFGPAADRDRAGDAVLAALAASGRVPAGEDVPTSEDVWIR